MGSPLWTGWALAAAITLFLSIGASLATSAPPWRWSDEQAHVGYAMEVARARLPKVDTPIRVPEGSPNLERRLEATPPIDGKSDPHVNVWVANHPPGAYVFALPLVWASELLGSGTSIVLALRLANVIGGALAVVATWLLAHELTRSRRIASLAAAMVATTPYLQFITSTAMTDGVTLALSTGVVWAACRAQRLRFDRSSTLLLAALAAGCGLTRMTALGVAAAAVATALVIHVVRHRSVPWRSSLAVAGAVGVASGWFWVANVVRYGDVAGSQELYDRFERAPSGSLWETLIDRQLWERLLDTLLSQQRDLAALWPGQASGTTVALLTLAAVGLLTALDLHARVDRSAGTARMAATAGERPGAGTAEPSDVAVRRVVERTDQSADASGWFVVAAASLASAVMVAQHVSDGGNPFGRYVLALLPFFGCAIATGIVRRRRAWTAALGGVVLVGYQLTLTYRYWAASGDAEALRRPTYIDPGTIGPDAVRNAVELVGYASGVALLMTTAAMLAWPLVDSRWASVGNGRRLSDVGGDPTDVRQPR